MNHETCHGPDRRGFLAGGLGGLLGLSIPVWQARAAGGPKAAKSCILLWMNGGPSHVDTFDPKPGSPDGGPFKAIGTRQRGVRFSEHLPQLADAADKLAVVRSMSSTEGNHVRGRYLLHTGYSPSVTLKHPGFGAWVSEAAGPAGDLPHFVSVRGPSVGAGFLGVEHNPFVVRDPSEGVRDIGRARDVTPGRFTRRLEALDFLQQKFHGRTGAAGIDAQNRMTAKAVRLMRSPLAKTFEIDREPESVRAAYGDSDFGRGCLMARRLIEAGVKFVEVTLDGWDTHYDNFSQVKSLSSQLDPAMATLVKELHARGRLDDTLVVCMGEFGRSPKVMRQDGRDHHPAAWSMLLAGGGVRAGQVYGATDATGAKVVKDKITVPDLFATLATLMGLDPHRERRSPVGRPISISDGGDAVAGLIA